MGFLTFWRRVVVVALKHTLDLAQTIIFILILGTGIGSRFVPKLAPVTQEVSGWQFAAILFGGIVFVRLFVLGPYWVWKEEHERAKKAESDPAPTPLDPLQVRAVAAQEGLAEQMRESERSRARDRLMDDVFGRGRRD